MVGGGVASKWNTLYSTSQWADKSPLAAFVDSEPVGDSAWQCGIGTGSGTNLTCYVKGCKLPDVLPQNLDCRTVLNANNGKSGTSTTASCPVGYKPLGCGMTNRYTGADTRMHTFGQVVPYSESFEDGCRCDMGDSIGLITCHARCCAIVPKPDMSVAWSEVVVPSNTACAECPLGKYSLYGGQSKCLECEEGKTTLSNGASSPSSCV